MPAGRPPKFKTPEDMQQAIDEYYDSLYETDDDGKAVRRPPTVSGLAYHLNMSTEALRNYEVKPEFVATVKRAKQRIEMALEDRLYGTTSPTGAIFNLKNNFGWKDKSEQDITSSDNSLPTTIVLNGVRPSDD